MLYDRRAARTFTYPTLFRSLSDEITEDAGAVRLGMRVDGRPRGLGLAVDEYLLASALAHATRGRARSEEHTSELQSHHDLVCRLPLEKLKDYNLPQWTGMDA